MTKTAEARDPLGCALAVDEKALEPVLAAIESTRLKIMFLLGQSGRMCVGEIASRFKISRPAISHHLKVLKSCGLVQPEREGQEVYYSVCKNRIVETLRTLAEALDACCRPGGSK